MFVVASLYAPWLTHARGHCVQHAQEFVLFLDDQAADRPEYPDNGHPRQQREEGSQGRMNIEIRSGGKLGLDVRGLAFASSKKAIEGWGASTRGST